MSTLLVITAGQTDVQLVAGGVRKEFDKKRCAALHEALVEREWTLVDAPPTKTQDEVQELPPEGDVFICTPKLDAVLAFLAERCVTLTHALVLHTARRDVEGDPHQAGRVLERRLAERAPGLVPLPSEPFLTGDERLEDRRDPRDALIRRVVVARLDGAVAAAIEAAVPERVVVATTGGIPPVSNLVEEIVHLRTGSGVEVVSVEVADGSKARPPRADIAVPRRQIADPAASFQVRRHALALLEQGNLVAAWGAVRHLQQDEVEHRWTRVVQWLYLFAASLPLPGECDLYVLRHPRMAARAALRVEFALRAGDVPRAVHGTVAFFEAALWDHLGERARPHPQGGRLYALDPAPAEELVRAPEKESAKRENGKRSRKDSERPFELVVGPDGTHWYRVFDDAVCGVRLAKHYLGRTALTKLGQDISRHVRDLRNDVAHNEPTPALMDDARRRMIAADLWSADNPPRFLSRGVIEEVLAELGARVSCAELLYTVRRRLLKP